MEEKFVVIMFTGHGGIMTEINKNFDMSQYFKKRTNRSSRTKIK